MKKLIFITILLLTIPAYAGSIRVKDEGSTIGYPWSLNFTGSGVTATMSGSEATINVTTGSGAGLSDAYTSMTDGTNTSNASGADTFRFRSANSLLSLSVTDNDSTYGDNLLLTVEPNLSNYTNDAGFLTSESDPLFSAMDTETELESHLIDVTNVYTNNDGNLTDDDLSDNSINDLSDVTLTTPSDNQILKYVTDHWENWTPNYITGVVWGDITGTLSNQTDLQNALNAKEDSISAGTTAQYWRGDKTWRTLDTSVVPENGNLYYTTARFNNDWNSKVLADISDVDTTGIADNYILKWDATNSKWVVGSGSDGASQLNDLSDVTITTPSNGQLLKYNGSVWENWTPNYLTSESDPVYSAWDKSTGITITASQVSDFDTEVSNNPDVAANTAKVTESTTVSAPLSLVGYNISLPKASSTQDGYLSSTDWTTFNNKLDTETDPVVGAINGIIKADGSGNISAAVSGTDYTNIGNTVESSEIMDGTIVHTDVSSSDSLRKCALHFTIDGGGSAITTGGKAWVRVPYNMTLTGWDITADVSGSITIDVYKDTYANFPPDSADTMISTGTKPNLSSAVKNQDTTIDWAVTTINEGDYIKINVDSVSTLTKVYLTLYGYKN